MPSGAACLSQISRLMITVTTCVHDQEEHQGTESFNKAGKGGTELCKTAGRTHTYSGQRHQVTLAWVIRPKRLPVACCCL